MTAGKLKNVGPEGSIDGVTGVLKGGCQVCVAWDARDGLRALDPSPESLTIPQIESRVPCVLCYTCGLGVVPGHSRWRLVLCGPCKAFRAAFNERWGTGIPLGIHSIVNGYTASIDKLEQAGPVAAASYWSQLDRGIHLVVALRDYGADVVARRSVQLGLTECGVPVERHLEACAAAGITQRSAWKDFETAWFGGATILDPERTKGPATDGV